jgi:hypothetical protein
VVKADPGRELEVVWEEDIAELDYVRETAVAASGRRRIAKWRGEGRRVGYALLKPDAPCDRAEDGRPLRGTFTRRVFFLKDHDRDSEPNGVYERGCPAEAVDPRAVHAGIDVDRT